jgi:hypothetical protein
MLKWSMVEKKKGRIRDRMKERKGEMERRRERHTQKYRLSD